VTLAASLKFRRAAGAYLGRTFLNRIARSIANRLGTF